MTHTTRSTSALALCAAACLFVLTACGGGDDDEASSDEPTSQASDEGKAEAGAGTDLGGIPEVVAEVNGEQVTRDEFLLIYEAQLQQATAQAQQSGEQPDEEAIKEQTANNLVDTELLAQEAEARGIEVSAEDVDAELTSLAESNQLGSAQEFIDAVEAQGTTEEQVRSQIEIQVMVEQLVANEVGPSEPTEEELRAIYAEAKQQAAASGQGQQIPPFAEVRDQIVEQAQTDQVGAVAQELVDELREDADITINL